MASINSMANQQPQITAAQFASKFNSKREIYNFLTLDVGAYLPQYDTITVYFLKDLIAGSKKCKSFHSTLTFV